MVTEYSQPEITMTRLELAVMLRKEAGIGGTGPTSTLNQSGEYELIVDWIDLAYNRIQSKHPDWQFLRADFTASISSGTGEYTPSAAGVTEHATWIVDDVRCYLTATGVSDEQEVYYIAWDEFRRTYRMGSTRTQTGRPSYFTIKPNDSLDFWPIPDDSYTVVGEHYKTPDLFTADDDEPILPTRFHEILAWSALNHYGANYVENDKYVHGQNEYRRIKALLELDQRPQLGFGAPLA